MSHGVVAQTRFAGSTDGIYADDLVRAGKWPRTQAIRRITKVEAYKIEGSIIDALKITYQVGDRTVTEHHGGSSTTVALSFDLGINDKIVAVYGVRNRHVSQFGARNIVQLSFVVSRSESNQSRTNIPTVKVQTANANSTAPVEGFDLSWAFVAVSSFTAKPSGSTVDYLQGIGFSKVLGLPGSPLSDEEQMAE
jgi:hypothetical protein